MTLPMCVATILSLEGQALAQNIEHRLHEILAAPVKE